MSDWRIDLPDLAAKTFRTTLPLCRIPMHATAPQCHPDAKGRAHSAGAIATPAILRQLSRPRRVQVLKRRSSSILWLIPGGLKRNRRAAAALNLVRTSTNRCSIHYCCDTLSQMAYMRPGQRSWLDLADPASPAPCPRARCRISLEPRVGSRTGPDL